MVGSGVSDVDSFAGSDAPSYSEATSGSDDGGGGGGSSGGGGGGGGDDDGGYDPRSGRLERVAIDRGLVGSTTDSGGGGGGGAGSVDPRSGALEREAIERDLVEAEPVASPRRTVEGPTVDPRAGALEREAIDQGLVEAETARVDAVDQRSGALEREAIDQGLVDSQRTRIREEVAADIDQQVGSVDVDTADIVRTSDGDRFRLDDETAGDVARQRAAAEDPLREPEDFVADASGGEVDVRRRARPFFEEQREAVGLNPPEESGIRRSLREESRDVQGFFDAAATRQEEVAPSVGGFVEDRDIAGSDQLPTVTQGDQTRGAGTVFDVPGAIDSAARLGERAANVGQARVESTAAEAGLADDLDVDADAFDDEVAAQQTAVEQGVSEARDVARADPGIFVGAIGAGVATSAGVGLAGRAATVGARSRLATRGARGSVDFEAIERPDVRAGESRLTRFSQEAVPGGRRSMDPDDFPVTPRDSPDAELRELADSFETEDVRQRLDADPEESTLFSARGGTKPEEFELRSGRRYDPDAAFFAGSVSRNFLDVTPESAPSLGLRAPAPIDAVRSIRDAARGDTPSILATAGRVEPLPDDVRTRGEITDFLESQANTGRFFTRQADNQSGEAEAITAAEGAESTADPLPGAGRIEPGDATRFVEVGRRAQTDVNGEGVPIQFVRQDTGDVTPRSEQGVFGGIRAEARSFLGDDRGQLSAGGTGRRRATSRSTSPAPSSTPFSAGGRPGTPLSPVAPSSGVTDADIDSATPGVDGDIGGFGAGVVRRSDADSPTPRSDSDTSPVGSPSDGAGGPFGGGSSTAVSETQLDSPIASSPFGAPTSLVGSSPTASPTDSPIGSPTSSTGAPSSPTAIPGSPAGGGVFGGGAGGGAPASGFGGVGGGGSPTGGAPSGGTPPTTPDTPPTGRSGRPRVEFDLEEDRIRDRRRQDAPPQTPLFANPVASGADQLFGVSEDFETAPSRLF